MKLVKPSFEILEQGPGLQGIYKQIELAGRTCYKSLDKITDDSAEGFVNRMINSKHYAMLEHGAVYLAIPTDSNSVGAYHHYGTIYTSQFEVNPYSRVNYDPDGDGTAYVTTNLRVLFEYFDEDDREFILGKYLCDPTEFHERRVTVKFISNIHFYKDITRHRKMSFAIESTRYCNYSKDKFGNELTFIVPVWSDLREGTISYYRDGRPMWESLSYTDNNTVIKDNYSKAEMDFVYAMQIAENMYINCTLHGWQAQQAAEILPQATKADIVITGFVSDWNYVFDLRARGTTGAPHPEVKRLMEPLMHEFETRNLIQQWMNSDM